jgi:hypothetical protein
MRGRSQAGEEAALFRRPRHVRKDKLSFVPAAIALPSIDALMDFVGGDVTIAPLPSAGFSNASITRLTNGHRRFVLKRTTLHRDWTARRSDDARGREALLPSDDSCVPLWDELLGTAIDEDTWRRLEHAAIVSGARMLLWSKALALESGRAGAQEEWDWWIERLSG